MAQIGPYSFIGISGMVPVAQWRVEDITRPGSVGVAYRADGFRGAARSIESWVDYINNADVAAKTLDYKALASHVVQITDNHGNTWNGMLIERVEIVRARAALHVVGGLNMSSAGLITVRWGVRPTATVY